MAMKRKYFEIFLKNIFSFPVWITIQFSDIQILDCSLQNGIVNFDRFACSQTVACFRFLRLNFNLILLRAVFCWFSRRAYNLFLFPQVRGLHQIEIDLNEIHSLCNRFVLIRFQYSCFEQLSKIINKWSSFERLRQRSKTMT